MRDDSTYPRDFFGPERLCDWCGELADGCACRGGLTLQCAAQSVLLSEWQKSPRPARTTDRMSPDLKHHAFAHVGIDITRREYPQSEAILARQFWCPYCQRTMPIHVCMNVARARAKGA